MKPELIDLLCNPYKNEPFWQEGDELVGIISGQRFPIRSGIPVVMDRTVIPSKVRRMQKFYDLVSGLYDPVVNWGSAMKVGTEEAIRASVIKNLPIQAGSRVLETAIGTGGNLEYLPDEIDLFGQDVSFSMLQKAVKKANGLNRAVEFFQSDGAYLPFRDELFDWVIHMGGLQFYADPFRGISEMVRVAKSGTQIVVIDQIRPAMRMMQGMSAHVKYAKTLEETAVNMVRLVPFNCEDFSSELLPGGEFYYLQFKKK